MPSTIRSLVLLSLLAAPAVAAAQSSSATPARTGTEPSTVTLSGCVSGKPLVSGDYTFVDQVTGSKYRLTGKGLRKYAGQEVEIVSRPDKSFAVKGGLFPSPNLAAQAGGLDPAQEAIARQPGGAASGTAGTELPEFRVARVRALPGACQ